jgi:RNA recognition motif-containing protein
MNIQINNLDAVINNNDLQSMFSAHGEVSSAEVAFDSFTGNHRGFGFVEMPDEDAGRKAIAALNNTELHNRVISVVEAKPKLNHKGSYKVGNGAVEAYRFRKS